MLQVAVCGPNRCTETETRLAREGELAPNIRLSCQIRVSSDLWVAVINRASEQGIDPGTRPLD